MILDIARDYHKTGLTPKEIGKKYNITESHARYKGNEIDPNFFTDDPDWCLIKIPRNEMEKAIDWLQKVGIEIDIPKKFELIETIESKMNENI